MTALRERFATQATLIDSATHCALDQTIRSLPTGVVDADFADSVRAAISGGKKFRGLLAFLGASLAEDEDDDARSVEVNNLAAALELYQASALVHDDIIDHAFTRRGAATTHQRLAGTHRNNGWVGSAEEFGQSGAILVGDFLFSAAECALHAQCRSLRPTHAQRLMDRFTTMHAEVAAGQFLDLRSEQLPLNPEDSFAISAQEARRVIVHKSARYSIVHPAALGALAAGASDSAVSLMDSILTPWGIAFQLRDDVLGVFGDPSVTGKPAGDDLREGKRTVLLALTWAKAPVRARGVLVNVLGNAQANATDISLAQEVVATYGQADHEREIAALVDEGNRLLDAADLCESITEDLHDLAQILTDRVK
ncbi:polyprenyl synthetase family protein [Schaalia sp. ZJ1691]|uniref:polyprenyl synthetase family protein n=1 Tax=Schaalia sp. ZJ1691 TaxID=2709404 RepID=UPI0013ED95D0|nr:polyprenyl synthetase family protein [Schaalia sp. ZJ1691]